MKNSVASFFLKIPSMINSVVYGNSSPDNTNLRFLLTVYFYGGICGVGASISNFILDLDAFITYSAIIMGFVFLAIHRSLFKEWVGFKSGVRLFYFISITYFNMIWFPNAGLDGGIIIFFYLLVIVIMIYSEGLEKWFHLSCIMLNITILIVLEYYFENWATPFPSRLERYVDVWVSILISFIVNYIAISVMLKALHRSNKQLEEKYRIISKDVDLASKVQQAIMSYKLEDNKFDVASIYKPVSGVGGDIYSIDELDQGKVRIFLADATGHGVQAGLVTMLILSEYLKRKLEFLDPGSLIADLNKSFIHHYSDIRAIFTCIVVDLDLENQEISYASAGHIPQILFLDGKSETLEKTGPIIGLKDNASYAINNFKGFEHLKLVLYSDGISEAFNENKEMFGEERLFQLVKNCPINESMHSFLRGLEIEMKEFIQSEPLQDDITILGIQNKLS
ncbi:MAG: serine/threonine-protein phosphatase [Leptospira sp.]|nr:serine/threonine-protein phosphatase [Leptospira sp.]